MHFWDNNMMVFEIIGWLGTISILLAYFLVSAKKISSSSKGYHLMNLFGGITVTINSLVHGATPSVGLNGIWSLIAVYGLINAIKK